MNCNSHAHLSIQNDLNYNDLSCKLLMQKRNLLKLFGYSKLCYNYDHGGAITFHIYNWLNLSCKIAWKLTQIVSTDFQRR